MSLTLAIPIHYIIKLTVIFIRNFTQYTQAKYHNCPIRLFFVCIKALKNNHSKNAGSTHVNIVQDRATPS